MPKSRLSATLSVFLVFFSGAVLGAFTYRLYSLPSVQPAKDSTSSQRKMSPEEFRKKYMAGLSSAVKLDPQQVTALNEVMDQTHEEFDKLNEKIKPERDALYEKFRPERDAIQSRQVERINAVLRPEQRPLFAAFRAERDRQRKLHEQQRKKQEEGIRPAQK